MVEQERTRKHVRLRSYAQRVAYIAYKETVQLVSNFVVSSEYRVNKPSRIFDRSRSNVLAYTRNKSFYSCASRCCIKRRGTYKMFTICICIIINYFLQEQRTYVNCFTYIRPKKTKMQNMGGDENKDEELITVRFNLRSNFVTYSPKSVYCCY